MNPFVGVTALALALLAVAAAWKKHPEVRLMAVLALAALLAGWRAQAISGRAVAGPLVLLCLLELGSASGANWPNLKNLHRTPLLAQLDAHEDIAAFLRAQPGPVRVAVNDQDVPCNFGDWHGIDTLGGYVAGVTANIFELGTHQPHVQDLLAVNYAISRRPTRPGQELVFSGASGVNVYRNSGALPRARIAHELASVSHLERCEGGRVEVLTMRPSRVVLKATAECRSMVVLADTAFPGWHARVDGHPAPIHEVYGAVRGIVVEGGTHLIEMTYLSASALLGGAMTLLGLLGAAAMSRL